MIKGLKKLDTICDRIYNLDGVDYTKPMYFNDIWTDMLKESDDKPESYYGFGGWEE